MRVCRTPPFWLVAAWLLLASAWAQAVQAEGGIVLLSFDTEFDPDAAAVEALAIDVPATYFFTGEYALAHSDLLRRLAAEGHTIGSHSHSHDHLKELPAAHLDKDLRLSKMVLEAISGVDVRWFRAPFLEYTDAVMQTVQDVGLSRDSSDIADWLQNKRLPELAISFHEGRLASDYSIFEQDQLSDRDALDWLIDAYERRAGAGQPLVVLLHPRIIGEHASVLHDFIAHVKAAGGTFQTMDAYFDGLRQTAAPEMVGLWVDLSFESVDPATLVSDARSIGVTDVFLSVLDPAGISYLSPDPEFPNRATVAPILAALRRAGIRVHAWIAVNSNTALATGRPELAMQDAEGNPSVQWISPSNDEARAFILDTVRQVLTAHDVDGLHLDYIRYPGLEYGFSGAARARFLAASGLGAAEPGQLVSEFYGDWVNWRMREIAGLVADIRQTADSVAGPETVLSAALIGDAAVDYRSREKFGQDYRLLARELDLILPMAYYPIDRQTTDWVRRLLYAARWQAGDTQVVAGLASFNDPGNWRLTAEDMATALDHALTLTDGATFYPYSGLFNRRDADSSVGQTVLETVRASLAKATRWRGFEIVSRVFENTTLMLSIPAGVLALLAIGLALTGRRTRPTEGTDTAVLELPAPLPDADWHDEEAECQSGTISGATCERISHRLRALPADMLDAARLLALLPRDAQTGRVSDIPNATSTEDVLLLQHAVSTGLLRNSGSGHALTEAGHAMLSGLRARGIDPDYAGFLVRRMREVLTAPCASCRETNRFHFFWASFECSACGQVNACRTIGEIEVSQPLSVPRADRRAKRADEPPLRDA